MLSTDSYALLPVNESYKKTSPRKSRGACFSILSDRKNGMMASLIPVKSALQNL